MSASRILFSSLAVVTAASALFLLALSPVSSNEAERSPADGDAAARSSAIGDRAPRSAPSERSLPRLTAPPGGSAARKPSVGQLLRTTERASILQAVVDHEPMARGTTVRLAIEVEVVAGMHVNANPPSHEWLIPVEASVAGADGIRVLEAFYPEAQSRKFPYSEEPFLVYEGTFVIGLTLAADAGIPAGGHRLEVVLDYQACNDEACFAPATTSSELRVMVVADPADAMEIGSPLLERAPFPR